MNSYELLLFILVIAALAAGIASLVWNYRRAQSTQPIDFRDLLEGMMDGIWLIDREARTTFVNPELTRMFKMTEQEMMGKTIFELIAPEGVENARQAFSRRNKGEKTTGNVILKLINGTLLRLRFSAAPVYDRRGQINGALAVLSDTSENDRMAQELRHNEERYRTIFENVNDIIYAMNADGKIESLNPVFTHITGWKIDTWLGRPAVELIHPDDRDQFNNLLTSVGNPASGSSDGGGGSATGAVEMLSSALQARMLTRSDQDVLVEIKVQPILKQGVLEGYTCVARDITARRMEALQELQVMLEYERLSMLNRFIRNASHDLRTPLSIVNSSAYLVRRKLPEVEREMVQPHLEVIEQQVMHLNEQLNNLFTISEDYVDTHLPHEQYDLNDLTAMTVEEITPVVERKRQHLTLEKLDEPATIICNPDEVQRALRHILLNASSYTLPEGSIKVRLFRRPGIIALEVQDNGIGIAADQIPHIFEPFYRVDEARGLDTGGMGLGLTISHAILESHGGRIEVESTLDEGTTVTLFFPVTLGKS